MSLSLYKTSFFALLACCVQCFSSCSKDMANVSVDDTPATGWVSLRITLPTPLGDAPAAQPSRAAANGVSDGNTGDTYVGNAGDNGINLLIVGIYNAQGECVHGFYVFPNDVIGGSFQRNPFQVKAKALKPDNYTVFAAANPTTELKNLIDHRRPLSELISAASNQTVNRLASRQIVMMCSQEMSTLLESRIRSTKPAAEEVPVPITLERAVAKVFVNPKANQTIAAPNAAGGTAQMVNFSLTGLNSQMYFLRRPAQAIKTNGTVNTDAVLYAEDDKTPQINRYSIDPNMEPLSGAALNAQLSFNKGEVSTGGWEDDKGLFATENTVNADNQTARQLTHAVVCLKYIPKYLPANTNSWAYYKGAYMTVAQLREKIQQAKLRNTTDASMEMPSGWKEDVARMGDRINNISESARSFEMNNLKFYQNGYNYYYVPIRHFDDRQQPKLGAYGRYGVVRNHLYKINITSVLAPGSPVEGEPSDEPVDQIPTYISANITVKPWTEVRLAPFALE